jgi:hypothetical protein
MLGREQTATADREQAGLGEAEITGHITRARNIQSCYSTDMDITFTFNPVKGEQTGHHLDRVGMAGEQTEHG